MPEAVAQLGGLNTAPDDDALHAALHACCAADSWIRAIVAARPYANVDALCAVSDVATTTLDAMGTAQALAGHPRIGERAVDDARAWSTGEQAGLAGADRDLRHELAAANRAYEQTFGHVYLVCATGRSAQQLLDLCRARLGNDPATEHGVVLAELAAINRLRLEKLLREGLR